MFLIWILLDTFLQWLFVLFPLLLLRSPYKLWLIGFAFLFLENFVLNLFRGSHFFGLTYNWQGKILEIAWPLLAIYLFHLFTPKEVGYIPAHKKTGYVMGALLGISIALIMHAVDYFSAEHHLRASVEDIAFQLTMPGFAEEPVYRGIFFALFARYIRQKYTCFGIPIPINILLTSLLFTAVHIVGYSPSDQTLFFYWSGAIFIFIAGLILGYLREKTGSIWPCVIMHNIANTLLYSDLKSWFSLTH